MALHHEVAGSGPPVVFLHPGIADSGVWEPQWQSYAGRHTLVRIDLPGFGRSPLDGPTFRPAADVADVLEELGIRGAAFVGCSLGGRVALELTVARPDLVSALVLVGAGLPDFTWSEQVRQYDAAGDEALARGDLDAAVELSLRMWVDGPNRSPGDVDPAVRSAVAAMQRRAFELQAPFLDRAVEEPLVPEVAECLRDIRLPTLVMVGEEDVPDVHELGEVIASSIRGALRAGIRRAAHVPSLEQPIDFDSVVLPFLAAASASVERRAAL